MPNSAISEKCLACNYEIYLEERGRKAFSQEVAGCINGSVFVLGDFEVGLLAIYIVATSLLKLFIYAVE